MPLNTIHIIRDAAPSGPWQYGELFLGTVSICHTAEDKDALLPPGNYDLSLEIFPRFNIVWPKVVGHDAWLTGFLPPRFDLPLNIELGHTRVRPSLLAAVAGQDMAMARVLEIMTHALDTPKNGVVMLRRFPRDAKHKRGASRHRTPRPRKVKLKITVLD